MGQQKKSADQPVFATKMAFYDNTLSSSHHDASRSAHGAVATATIPKSFVVKEPIANKTLYEIWSPDDNLSKRRTKVTVSKIHVSNGINRNHMD